MIDHSKLTDEEAIQWFSNVEDEIKLLIDKTGRIKYIHPIIENVSKHAVFDILDQNLLDYIHPNDKEKTVEHLLQAQLPHRFTPFVIRFLRKDGFYCRLHVSSGKLSERGWIQAIIRNADREEIQENNSVVTEEQMAYAEAKKLIKKQNELLLIQEKMITEITENIEEVICLYDIHEMKVLYESPSFKHFWGMSAEAILKDPNLWLKKVHEENKKKLQGFFRQPEKWPMEIEYEFKGERESDTRWIRSKITPIVIDETKKVLHYLCVSRDITDIKKRDHMLKKRDELGIIGQLAAGIAHEIRNPLTAVKGFIQLLGEETKNVYSDVIMSELERIEFIMNEFLMLAKPEQEAVMKKQSVNELLNEMIAFMTPEALLHQVEIKMELDQEQPIVDCEPKQIKQVIMNLVKNAIEAMPAGGEVRITTKKREDGWMAIDIKDQGIGIPKEKQIYLFEPFYSEKERGTGLGLMVSKKIIEQHKGKIHIYSEEGSGTLVQILMPERPTT